MGMPVKVKDKVSSFLCLHSDKTKNLLLPNIGIPNVFRNNGDDDREWICHEQDRSQSAGPSKLNIRFTGSTTLFHWEGHNSFIQSEFEVNEHLMESLFDKILNGSGLTSRSHWHDLQTIMISCRYLCQKLCRRGPDIHPWDPGPSWSTPQGDGQHLRDAQGRPPPWLPP